VGEYQQDYQRLKDDPDSLEALIARDVRVSQQDVIADILKQSQIFMAWSYYHVLAEYDAKVLKLRLTEEVYPACRKDAEQKVLDDGRKATKDTIHDYAVLNPVYKVAQENFLWAERRAHVLKAVVEALRQKKDMLQSLNSRQRVELGDYRPEYVPADPSRGRQEHPIDVGGVTDTAKRRSAPSDESPGASLEGRDVEELKLLYRAKRRARGNDE
jgi:hypothetical protein